MMDLRGHWFKSSSRKYMQSTGRSTLWSHLVGLNQMKRFLQEFVGVSR